jgi:hypothetical protein
MNINILDGQVPDQLRAQVWEYIQDQTWYAKYKKDSSIVPFVPGRIIAYDSRTLHTTRPAATWAKNH